MTETPETPTTSPEAMPEQPVAAPMKSLNEYVHEIVTGAAKPLAFAAVKKALKERGVPVSGKGKVTDDQIAAALAAEGIHEHAAAKEGGKPAYWHTRKKSVEELATDKAEAKAKKAADKVAATAEKKRVAAEEKATKLAEAKAQKEAEKAEKKRLAEEAKAADKERKTAEAAEKKRIAEEEKSAKKAQAQAKKDVEKAEAQAKKDADKAEKKRLADDAKAAKKIEDQAKKDAAKAEKKRLADEAKAAKKASIPWYEKTPGKSALAALAKAAKKVVDLDGATADYVLDFVQRQLALAPDTEPEPTLQLDLATFAKRVLEISATTSEEAKPYSGKVYIAAAWHATKSITEFKGMSLHDFKQRLVEANKQGLVELSQATEVQAMNMALLEESKTTQNQTVFHFIRLHGV